MRKEENDMRDYKDEIIEKLCGMLNCLEDNGCLLEEDKIEYRNIMEEYASNKMTENMLDEVLPDGYAYYSNCYILRSREDGEIIVKSYDKEKSEVMMRDVSKQICFSDCDDTYEVIKIVYHGREVEYNGWQPGMVMSYDFAGTDDLAWEESFPQYDH
jgi:hypothetical protein